MPELKIGDYVEGYEQYGYKEVYIRGTIYKIEYNEDGTIKHCEIQCDDSWKGARANSLNPKKKINKVEKEIEWWKTIDRFKHKED